jgi:LCP family protein required for cell wall assembly
MRSRSTSFSLPQAESVVDGTLPAPRVTGRPRRHVVVLVVNLVVAASLVLTGSLVLYANGKVSSRLVVDLSGRTDVPVGSDSPAPGNDTPRNFLLTGSDGGACVDANDVTSGGIGDRASLGERSDTIMILRVDPTTTAVAILSFPRDLWVNIAGTNRQSRINSAFRADEPERLVRTIGDNFGIPVDHYVNVNFCAFKQIVDAVGGVQVPFEYATRDEKTGFRVAAPGCHKLDGSQALAYVRSRSGYRYFDTTRQEWLADPTGDIGRIGRQQDFLRRSMQRALDRGRSNPAVATQLLNAALDNVITDDRLTPRDLLALANAMRNVNAANSASYTIEWTPRRIGDQAVLLPVIDSDSMRAILEVFRGAPGDAAVTTGGAVALPTAVVRGVGATIAQLVGAGDTTTPPSQEQVGIVPPDDPSCR